MLAGPSEVLVIADETADAKTIAADLLAQVSYYPSGVALGGVRAFFWLRHEQEKQPGGLHDGGWERKEGVVSAD